MSDDIERIVGDLVAPLVDVLRDLHGRPGLGALVEQVCAEHGVEIEWDATPVEQDEEDRADDHR